MKTEHKNNALSFRRIGAWLGLFLLGLELLAGTMLPVAQAMARDEYRLFSDADICTDGQTPAQSHDRHASVCAACLPLAHMAAFGGVATAETVAQTAQVRFPPQSLRPVRDAATGVFNARAPPVA